MKISRIHKKLKNCIIFRKKKPEVLHMGNDQRVGNLAFMPWLTIPYEVEINDWLLKPVIIKNLTENEQDIRRVLECFHINAKRKIHTATVFQKKDKPATSELSKEEKNEFFLLCEAIAFSGLSNRIFFSDRRYSNYDCYKAIIQSFRVKSKFFVTDSRLKHGASSNIIPDELYLVMKEPHIPSNNEQLLFDPDFVKALLLSQNTESWVNIHESIFCFNQSNTDNSNIQIHTELMFALGAFERLLNINNGKCEATAKKFSSTLSSVIKEDPSDQDLKRNLIGRHQNIASLREIWLRDFCACRGDLAHGRRTPQYPSIWSPHEHLLLAAEIFPIIMKIKLSELSLYTLNNDDLEKVYVFDKLLRINNLFNLAEPSEEEDDYVEPKFGWVEVRKEATWNWAILDEAQYTVNKTSSNNQPTVPTSKKENSKD